MDSERDRLHAKRYKPQEPVDQMLMVRLSTGKTLTVVDFKIHDGQWEYK